MLWRKFDLLKDCCRSICDLINHAINYITCDLSPILRKSTKKLQFTARVRFEFDVYHDRQQILLTNAQNAVQHTDVVVPNLLSELSDVKNQPQPTRWNGYYRLKNEAHYLILAPSWHSSNWEVSKQFSQR